MRWIILAAATLLCATLVQGADLTALGAGAVRSALNGLAADWSHETGHRVSVSYAEAGELRKRLASGERADILILPREDFEALERDGLVERATRRDLGAVRTELQKVTIYSAAVMKGAPAAGVAGMLLDHLASEAGRKAFSARGFSAP